MDKERISEYTRRITDANRSELVVILYDMAIDYIDDAINASNAGDHAAFRENSGKANRVLSDLIGALDYDIAPAANLLAIYEFMIKENAMAVVKKDTTGMIRVRANLASLREAFVEVAKADTSESVMSNTERVYAGLTYGKGTLNESVAGADYNRGFSV